MATSLNNLAELYREQGKYDQAEPLYKRALKIFENALPANHPNIATTLENMGQLYKDMGKDNEAQKCLQRAKETRAGK